MLKALPLPGHLLQVMLKALAQLLVDSLVDIRRDLLIGNHLRQRYGLDWVYICAAGALALEWDIVCSSRMSIACVHQHDGGVIAGARVHPLKVPAQCFSLLLGQLLYPAKCRPLPFNDCCFQRISPTGRFSW